MKALTLWQPWASLIAIGAKPFEFRRWPAPRALWGQRIAIHAGARPVRKSEVDELIDDMSTWGNGLDRDKTIDLLTISISLPLSHVLCTALLGRPQPARQLCEIGLLKADSDRVDEHVWGWPLTEIEPLMPPIPARGMQGLWEWRATA